MNVKRLCLALSFMLILAVTSFGGETSTPPCPPPDPGEMQSPPCSSAQESADAPTSGQTSTPANASVTEYVIADTAINFVESVLSLF